MYEQLTSIWTIRTRKHEKIIIAICWEKHGGEAKVEGVLKSNEQKQQGPDSGDILHAQRVECKVTFGNKLSLGPLYCWARTTRTQFSCCSLYIYVYERSDVNRTAGDPRAHAVPMSVRNWKTKPSGRGAFLLFLLEYRIHGFSSVYLVDAARMHLAHFMTFEEYCCRRSQPVSQPLRHTQTHRE